MATRNGLTLNTVAPPRFAQGRIATAPPFLTREAGERDRPKDGGGGATCATYPIRSPPQLSDVPAARAGGRSDPRPHFFAFRSSGRGRRRGLLRLDPRKDGVGESHAGKRAAGRQQSGPECAANNRAQARNHRQEESDQGAGETGQDQEGGFRGDVDSAAARRGDAQARKPKKREDGDCRGDPNGQPPVSAFSLASHCGRMHGARARHSRPAPALAARMSSRRSEHSIRRRARRRSRPRACPASWSQSRWRRGARATDLRDRRRFG